MYASEAEIKQAVHKYCQRTFSADLSADIPFVFSAEHVRRMQQLIGRADRRRGIRTVLKNIAAGVIIVLAVFSAVCSISPKAWAAVRSWYVMHIGPDQVIYQFEHKGNDHAFPVAGPGVLPEGMVQKSMDEGDGYCRKEYENGRTGEKLLFSYHWLTVREKAEIDRMAETHGTVHLAIGYDAVLYAENGKNKLAWYDKNTLISYWAEGDLSEDGLIAAFDNMKLHPPVYVPTWLPDGYELADSDYGSSADLIYMDPDTEDIIWISTEDYGWVSQLPVWGEGETKDVTINGNEGIVMWGDGLYRGTLLVLTDRNRNLLVTIQTGRIDPDLVVDIAERLVIQQ